MSRVILFGAGATYGSEAVAPSIPPLGADLFDELRAAYPQAWGTIPDEQRPSFVPNFELGMRDVWESGSHTGPTLVRCMAHYFTRFRPLVGNTYSSLLAAYVNLSLAYLGQGKQDSARRIRSLAMEKFGEDSRYDPGLRRLEAAFGS